MSLEKKTSFQSLQSDTQQLSLLEKKHVLKKSSSDSFVVSAIAAPFIFVFFFSFSFISSIADIRTETPTVSPVTTTHAISEQQIEQVQRNINLFSPDLLISSIFNYNTVVGIFPSHVASREYLKKPDTPIKFSELDKKSNDLLIERLAELPIIDNFHDVVYVKHLMINEDLSIIPFKSGDVEITSEILETTQSQNYYMIVVRKTFTQNKKIVQVIEKKIFHLNPLENGKINFFANVLSTSNTSKK